MPQLVLSHHTPFGICSTFFTVVTRASFACATVLFRKEFHFHPPGGPQNSRPIIFMNLNEAQRQQVAAWVADGLKLSEIQTRLAAELGVGLTYMEVRLLVDDLKLTPKDPEPPKPATPVATPAASAKPPDALEEAAPATPPGAAGSVSVTVDKLARPGTLVSGKVTFSDGVTAEWYLDQTGRLGVIPKQQGYKPSAADVQQFQMALEGELAKLGF